MASMVSCPREGVPNPVDRLGVGAEDELQPAGRVGVAEVLKGQLALDRDERRGLAAELERVAVRRALDLPRERIAGDVEDEGDDRDRERGGRDDDRARLPA